MTLLRTLAAALAVALIATVATAQLSLLPNQTARPEAAAPAPAPGPSPAEALVPLLEALRDDAARAALIAELERLTAAPPPAAAAAPEPGETPAPAADAVIDGATPDATPRFGARLAALGKSAVEAVEGYAEGFLNGLAATQRRLAGLTGARSGLLADAARDLAAVIVATVGAFLLLRLAARRTIQRIDAAMAGAGALRRLAGWAGALVVGAFGVLVSWAVGVGVVVANLASGADTLSQENNALYLSAFLAVQLGKVAIRSALSPDAPNLRVAPLSDSGARYWSGRLGGLVSVLGYGLMVVVPLVSDIVSIFTGRAVSVVVYSVVLLWSMALVVRWRRTPADWMAARAEAAKDPTLRALAVALRVWHWPALAVLLSLFVAAVSRSGNVAPVLSAVGAALAALAVGGAVGAAMSRGARRGVRLPDSVKETLPLLEERLNGFMLRFLGVGRFVVAVLTVGAALQLSGLYDMGGWFARRFGEDAFALLGSVTAIVIGAFAVWLALASWVDYRLNPDRSDAADPRERTLLTLLRNAATIAIVIFTTMFTLSEIGLDIAPLLASAGVLGLAIGFGAQRLVQDIITGIFIQFENAINVGDVVTVAGVTGSVEKLTIRSVSLRGLDGTFHIIPFSSVDMVSNFMRGFAFHVADVGIAYRENISEAKALMHKAFDDVKSDPAHRPNILGALDWHGVVTLGDNAVTLRARVRTRPGAQWAVGRAYTEAVKRRFDEAGVEIPFPQTTVWFGQGKDGAAPPLPMPAAPAQPKAAE